jgi:hypothetical protein
MLGSREQEVRRFLRRLTQMGRLIEVARDHFFHPRPRYRTSGGRTSSRRAQSERQDHRSGFPLSHRYRTKTSDTDLEFFDRTGTTIREGDLRRIREDRPESLKGADS